MSNLKKLLDAPSFTPTWFQQPVTAKVESMTNASITAVTQKSALKASSASFIPASYKKRLEDSPVYMPLESSWSLHYSYMQTGEQYYDPCQIVDFKTVEKFWRIFNNIDSPAQMKSGSNLFMFRTHIPPKWECPENEQGGCWCFDVPRDCGNSNVIAADLWQKMCCFAIGENWGSLNSKNVYGVCCRVKEKTFIFQVWVPVQEAAAGSIIQMICDREGIWYKPHQISKANAAEKDKMMRLKQQQDKKKKKKK